MSSEKGLIVHICPWQEWRAAQAAGEYTAPSVKLEGFIHCSRPDQVLEVANRFYLGVPDLALLWIDPEKVQAEIRWEPSDGQLFPHIYGPLNLDAVTGVRDFPAGENGFFRWVPDQF